MKKDKFIVKLFKDPKGFCKAWHSYYFGADYDEKMEGIDPTKAPLYKRLNMCEIERFKILAPLGDLVAKLAVECNCCNGTRMLISLALGIGIGWWIWS